MHAPLRGGFASRNVAFGGPREGAVHGGCRPLRNVPGSFLLHSWTRLRTIVTVLPFDLDEIARLLDAPRQAEAWLAGLGVRDVARGQRLLSQIPQLGIPADLLGVLCGQLASHLPAVSDPDMALVNLHRFLEAQRSPLSLATLIERDAEALPTLLQIFSTSQHFSDVLITDSAAYDLLRITEGQPVTRDVLVEEICSEVAAVDDERIAMLILRRYKRRENLRIAYGDLIRGQKLEVVTEQISFLADALSEAALRTAERFVRQKRAAPRNEDGNPSRLVILALGKLGGLELNYSSDIDLMFLYSNVSESGSQAAARSEYFDRVAKLFTKLLSEPTPLGSPYRIDLRLRPSGRAGQMTISVDSALNYYDLYGRSWERQAFIKARPIAGDLKLGRDFLRQMEPWIYRRFLSRDDIIGIRALKRQIEARARRDGMDQSDVKTGHGGIRDIEFVIQFLQLLNGASPEIRTGNTLDALSRLERTGSLTHEERAILSRNYEFLRKIEHRLQIMFNLQTHRLPGDDEEMRKLAIRMGYTESEAGSPLEQFREEFQKATAANRRILEHLLHNAFGRDEAPEPEVDLVLDPEPGEAAIDETLAPYGFRDIPAAYKNLMALSQEKIRFLSTRRCRHFLAAIAPRLLAAIQETPDPDLTLVNLSKVSDSLGGKGVLWELFSFNPPSLHLYVQLCANSPYLSGILTSNPGMIDELMDSLLLDRLPTLAGLKSTLDDLCRRAEDPSPILHSFKNSQHLRVGVRDILGKEDILDTHRALSDIAEAILWQVVQQETARLEARYGVPTIEADHHGNGGRGRCDLVILAMGKLGGREPNYHSDLDVVFLYEAEGHTQPVGRNRRVEPTRNQHFFMQLAQKVIKFLTQLGPYGRLYEVDPRLRPTGKSGSLAISFEEFERYFRHGQGQLWERQALCKARPVFGSEAAQAETMRIVRGILIDPPWQPEFAGMIHEMRRRMEENASERNLKRGVGGTVDIEFLVQMLQLRHAGERPEVLTPGTLEALDRLREVGALSVEDADFFGRAYRFLRSIEARLRLMNTTARHDLPAEEHEVRKLAYLLGWGDPGKLVQECHETMRANRERFDALFTAIEARRDG